MKQLFLFISLFVFMVSCSTEEPMLIKGHTNYQQSNHKIEFHKALDKAFVVYDYLSEKENVKSQSYRPNINNIEYFLNPNTRNTRSGDTNNNDTLLFIVNFENNKGFSILSTDDRTRTIYAISTEGSINLADTSFNKGLYLFLKNTEADIIRSVASYPYIPVDTVDLPSIGTDIGDYPSIMKVKPKLPENVSKWGQGTPFNKYCFTINNNPALVGCTALSTAQVMAYHKYPPSYRSHQYDWEDMISDETSDDLAHLLHDLGNNENLQSVYGIAGEDRKLYPEEIVVGTSASFNRISDALTNMKYINPGSSVKLTDIHNGDKKINEERFINSIGRSPVIIGGSQWDGSKSHAWVIDGYIRFLDDPRTGEYQTPFYHCVWGWYGKGNGYFFWGDSGIDTWDPKPLDNDLPADEHYIYEVNMSYFGDLKHNQ